MNRRVFIKGGAIAGVAAASGIALRTKQITTRDSSFLIIWCYWYSYNYMRNIYINILDSRIFILPFIQPPKKKKNIKISYNCVFTY